MPRTTPALEVLEERVLLWSALVGDVGYQGTDGAKGVAVEPDGNVVAAGGIGIGGSDQFSVVKFDGQDGTVLWRTGFGGSNSVAQAVALDGAGDVVAAGAVPVTVNDHFAVVKLSGADGSVLWHTDVTSSSSVGYAVDVRVDAAGDVVAAGSLYDGTGFAFAVLKLRGSDGVELWRQTLHGADHVVIDGADSVRLDANNDVVAAGSLSLASGYSEFVVVKFSGFDGTPQWRYDLMKPNGNNVALSLSIDAAGDVAAAGRISYLRPIVVKLGGGDGAQLWMNAPDIQYNDYYSNVIFDGTGDLLARDYGQVFKWAGSDGTALWSRSVGFDVDGGRITVDSAGDVVAVGYQFGVAKLQGADGTILWQRSFGQDYSSYALAVAVDSSDDVVAGGYFDVHFFVVKLNGMDGGDFGPGGFPGGWPDASPRPSAVPNANLSTIATSMLPLHPMRADELLTAATEEDGWLAISLAKQNQLSMADELWTAVVGTNRAMGDWPFLVVAKEKPSSRIGISRIGWDWRHC
jgi:hypothetical protein